MDDTIFALSSGSNTGSQATAVAVIRISGPHAHWALQQLTKRPCQPRVATLATLRFQGRILDQALVLYFNAPHSFTGQDVVELHCHGSRAVLNDVLGVLEQLRIPASGDNDNNGNNNKRLRYAEAGEFTSRAFSAGKLDVLQVEALADLLASDTVLQKQQALSQLQGDLSRLYKDWKQQLIGALAHAEAIIDFGDDEHLDDWQNDDNNVDDVDVEAQKQAAQDHLWGGVTDQVQALRQSMAWQLQHAQRGEWVRQGYSVAIVGPPNAGKSSLFNVLAQDDQAAIVSPIQGTTRDILTVSLNLGGVKCRLLDTAGLRDGITTTTDVIEQEGMKRAQQAAARADLVLVLLDVSTLQSPTTELLRRELDRLVPARDFERGRVMLVLNKADLLSSSSSSAAADNEPTKSDMLAIPDDLQRQLAGTYTISCETQQGMNPFLRGLTDHVLHQVTGTPPSLSSSAVNANNNNNNNNKEDPLMTRGRHRQHVQAAMEALDRFIVLQRDGLVTVDMAAEELRLAASELGRLTGAIDVEEVLDQLFTDFCIGK